MPPPRPPMPAGFLLLGMVLVLAGAGCTAVVAVTRADVLVRALCGCIALVSLVLVEALWWVRPWVTRAVDAWIAVCIGAVLFSILVAAAGAGASLGEVIVVGSMMLLFVALPCVGVRWYVRDRARKLGFLPRPFAAPAAPVTVPSPRP